MNKSFIIYIGVILFLSACDIDKDKIHSYNEWPEEKPLNADSVPVQVPYDYVYITTYDDYLIVSSFQADTMLHVYSTPKLNYLFGGAVKGHSVTEFSSYPTFCESNGSKLFIRGHTPYIMRDYGIDETGFYLKNEYKLRLNSTPNNMHIVHDSLLYYMDFDEHSIKKYNVKKQKELLSKHISSNLPKTSSVIDVDKGCFATNNTTAMYAYQYKKEIEVFNTNDISKRFRIKWEHENQSELINSNNVDDVIIHYTGNIATKRFFYMLHRGFKPHDRTRLSHIEVYDNSGVPLIKFNLDKKLFSFAVDEKNGFFYGFGPNDEFIYRFKYDIPK